jgi:BMFP domain-containing protein YqiC
MAGRPANTAGTTSFLRVEVLKELQTLIDDREVRDRVDRGPLAETRGKEHWVLHLLLRSQELSNAHFDTLVGTAYGNLLARLQSVEDRLQRMETGSQETTQEVKTRLEGMEASVAERVSRELTTGIQSVADKLSTTLTTSLDEKWKPVGASIETFAQSSHQLTKDLSDTYRVSTQSRLLLNENARRIIDLGRDLVALEESLKLTLTKAIEEGLAPLEERIAALEGRRAPPAEAAADPAPESH